MTIKRPEISEYPSFYEPYIGLIKDDDIIRVLREQTLSLQTVLSRVPEEKENYSYAPGKWTLKEVIGHIVDTERVVGYRVLRFARTDKRALPGIEAEFYVKHGKFNKRDLYDLAHEFGFVRGANIALFNSLDEEDLSRVGMADEREMTVRAWIYMIAGHTTHHINFIKNHYL